MKLVLYISEKTQRRWLNGKEARWKPFHALVVENTSKFRNGPVVPVPMSTLPFTSTPIRGAKAHFFYF
jgi:hypothetical protein